MYAVTVTYTRPGLEDPQYTLSGSLPTFYLDENVQGIVSEAHASDIVRSSLVTMLPSADFNVCAVRL